MNTSAKTADDFIQYMTGQASEEKAVGMRRFFKTGKGEYAEGDRFLGIPNPVARKAVKLFASLPISEIEKLLFSEFHEIRTGALLIMVEQYRRGNLDTRKKLIALYTAVSPTQINNWDLVDLSAPGIIGEEEWAHHSGLIARLAESPVLWEQRIAVVATLTLIRHEEYDLTFQLVEKFLGHRHDLMHKACGWMLREVGKRNREVLTAFLNQYRHQMPRTMLRYAIEHYPEEQRQEFLKK